MLRYYWLGGLVVHLWRDTHRFFFAIRCPITEIYQVVKSAAFILIHYLLDHNQFFQIKLSFLILQKLFVIEQLLFVSHLVHVYQFLELPKISDSVKRYNISKTILYTQLHYHIKHGVLLPKYFFYRYWNLASFEHGHVTLHYSFKKQLFNGQCLFKSNETNFHSHLHDLIFDNRLSIQLFNKLKFLTLNVWNRSAFTSIDGLS